MDPNIVLLALLAAGVLIAWLVSRLGTLRSRIQEVAMAEFQAQRQKDCDAIMESQCGIDHSCRCDPEESFGDRWEVTEHVVPYLPEFTFYLKDVRFIGGGLARVRWLGLRGTLRACPAAGA
jgi:hypothetical protein